MTRKIFLANGKNACQCAKHMASASVSPINNANLLEFLRKSAQERPAVSDTQIAEFCKTVTLCQHLRALVILERCTCLFTAFLCWLIFPSYRRSPDFYRGQFSKPEVRVEISEVRQDAPKDNTVPDEEEPEPEPEPEPESEPEPDLPPSTAEMPPQWGQARIALQALMANSKGAIDSDATAKALNGLSDEDLQDNDRVILLLAGLVPKNFDMCNENMQKKIARKICQIANQIAYKSTHCFLETTSNVVLASNPNNEIKAQIIRSHDVNAHLAKILGCFAKNLPAKQRMIFLSTTVFMADNKQQYAIANLYVATFDLGHGYAGDRPAISVGQFASPA
jgi:hypothetical protein